MACGVVVTATLLMVIMIVVMVRFIILITKSSVATTCQGMRLVSMVLEKDAVNPIVLLQFIP